MRRGWIVRCKPSHQCYQTVGTGPGSDSAYAERVVAGPNLRSRRLFGTTNSEGSVTDHPSQTSSGYMPGMPVIGATPNCIAISMYAIHKLIKASVAQMTVGGLAGALS